MKRPPVRSLLKKSRNVAIYIGVAFISLIIGGFVSFGTTSLVRAATYPVGQLYWDGLWNNNDFSCDGGYTAYYYHNDYGTNDDGGWYQCQ